MQIELTREMARAIAQDAANAHMRKCGRFVWNRADYRAACRIFERLWPGDGDEEPAGSGTVAQSDGDSGAEAQADTSPIFAQQKHLHIPPLSCFPL